MRRAFHLLTVMGAAFLLVSGVAFAATLVGTNGADGIVGTNSADTLAGLGGDDLISGRGGDDRISGSFNRDRIFGGFGRDYVTGDSGNDYIDDGNDGVVDYINCGSGTDTVRADGVDVLRNCEYFTLR